MALLVLLVTLTLASPPGQGGSPQTRPALPPCTPGDPCCPPDHGDFCRVGCPPPVPTPIFRPAPDVTTLESPQPTGFVILEIAVNESGRAVSACVVRSLRPDADKAAQRAALRSTWTRKLLKGRPVGVFMTVAYQFPPPPGWTEPAVTPRSKLPITRGPVVFVDPAKACPAGQGGPMRVGPGIPHPPLLDYVEPHAPPRGVAGTVIVELVIGTDGAVSGVRALREAPGLTQLAVEAVEKWRYPRTCLDGQPIPVIITVTLTFGSPKPR